MGFDNEAGDLLNGESFRISPPIVVRQNFRGAVVRGSVRDVLPRLHATRSCVALVAETTEAEGSGRLLAIPASFHVVASWGREAPAAARGVSLLAESPLVRRRFVFVDSGGIYI